MSQNCDTNTSFLPLELKSYGFLGAHTTSWFPNVWILWWAFLNRWGFTSEQTTFKKEPWKWAEERKHLGKSQSHHTASSSCYQSAAIDDLPIHHKNTVPCAMRWSVLSLNNYMSLLHNFFHIFFHIWLSACASIHTIDNKSHLSKYEPKCEPPTFLLLLLKQKYKWKW